MRARPDHAVALLADRQHGVVARRQLLDGGLDRSGILSRVHAGRLHQLHPGVYAVGHRALTERGKWIAAVLACGDGALLSHLSAAALWGIDSPWKRHLRGTRTDVTIEGRHGRRRPGIAVHRPRRLEDGDRAIRDGIPVTSAARTLLDLAGMIGARKLERSWDEADRLGLLDPEAIVGACDRARGHRGTRALRRLLAAYLGPPPMTRSQLERHFLRFCRRFGLPEPLLNAEIAGFEVDALWPARRLVVELDGFEFHRTRASFERDRARDEQLKLAGCEVLRVTHRRLVGAPEAVAETIGELLRGGPAELAPSAA